MLSGLYPATVPLNELPLRHEIKLTVTDKEHLDLRVVLDWSSVVSKVEVFPILPSELGFLDSKIDHSGARSVLNIKTKRYAYQGGGDLILLVIYTDSRDRTFETRIPLPILESEKDAESPDSGEVL